MKTNTFNKDAKLIKSNFRRKFVIGGDITPVITGDTPTWNTMDTQFQNNPSMPQVPIVASRNPVFTPSRVPQLPGMGTLTSTPQLNADGTLQGTDPNYVPPPSTAGAGNWNLQTGMPDGMKNLDDQVYQTPRQPVNWTGAGNKILPYATNIANSLRRAPAIAPPDQIAPVYASKVNYNNQRAETENAVRSQNGNFDKTLDGNSAAIAKASTFASGRKSVNSINETESNTNAQIQNSVNQTNAGINAQNTAANNLHKRDIVEQNLANQRFQSENQADATNKYIAQGNEKSKAELDLNKWKVLSQMYNRSGVADRITSGLEAKGDDDPTGVEHKVAPDHFDYSGKRIKDIYGKLIQTAAFGGSIKNRSSKMSVYSMPPRSSMPSGMPMPGANGQIPLGPTTWKGANGGSMRRKVNC